MSAGASKQNSAPTRLDGPGEPGTIAGPDPRKARCRLRGNLHVAALAVLLGLAGCASVNNLGDRDRREVYGGTRLDAELVSKFLVPDDQASRAKGLEPPVAVAAGCYGLVDMPFSAVADTLLLPVTVPASLHRRDAAAKHAEATAKTRDDDAAAEE